MYSLLLVDDETEILQGIYEMLCAADLPLKEIRTASDAGQALREFEKSPFDIILSDIRMPEMDGLELVARTREIWPETQVVFLTGYRDFEYARTALQLGSVGYLLKPIADEQLLEALNGVISNLNKAWTERLEQHDQHRERTAAFQKLREHCFRSLAKEPFSGSINELIAQLEELDILLSPGSPLALAGLRIDAAAEYAPETIHFLVENVVGELLSPMGGGFYCRMEDGTGLLATHAVQNSGDAVRLEKLLQELQSFFHDSMGILLSLEIVLGVPWDSLPEAVTRIAALWGGVPSRFYSRDCAALLAESGEPEGPPANASSGGYIVKSVKDYIEAHYGEALSLSSLAGRFRINPSYLSRLFHRHVGEQLSAYITGVRIAKAREMLAETDLRVYQIAERLGFDTPSYFARVFGRATGLSPKEYRIHSGNTADID